MRDALPDRESSDRSVGSDLSADRRERIKKVSATAHNTLGTDWRMRTVADRARIISKAASILRENADEFAQIITLEMGKRSCARHVAA
jgi:acyl-CoA reductase-like NAD-dependent aldehyde dehydrogenase